MGVSFVLRLIKPYSDVMGATVFLMLLSALAGLALPMLGGSVAEGVLTDAGANVGSLLLSILIIFLGQAVLKYISEVMSARTSTRLHADLRGRVYDHVQALPLEFHLARERGDIIALLSSEVNHLAHFVTSTIVTLTPLLVTFCGAAYFMIQIDLVLGSVIAVLIPIFFIMMRVLSGRLKPIGAELREAQAKLLSILQENMGLIPAIKTFNREPIESERYRAQADKIKELDFALRRSGAKLQPAVQLAAGIAVVAVLWFASQGMQQGTMTPAELITFLLFAALIIRPMNQLAGFWGEFQAARGAAERLTDVLDLQPEDLGEADRSLKRFKGDIEFRDVSFGYSPDSKLLDRVNLHIKPGERIAILGENGVGKSSFVQLMLGLYRPKAGSIRIDGQDIDEMKLHQLREHIALVPQNVSLLNGTIADNIEFGRPGASKGEIERAARLAQAHGFISKLPHGYRTEVGENGVWLSGGQRQRLALARALLKDPSILILDEATAMFDIEGERAFFDAADSVFQGRTVIIISHTESVLASADRVLKLEGGKLESPTVRPVAQREKVSPVEAPVNSPSPEGQAGELAQEQGQPQIQSQNHSQPQPQTAPVTDAVPQDNEDPASEPRQEPEPWEPKDGDEELSSDELQRRVARYLKEAQG